MKFCDTCGSFMRITPRGYACPRCGKEVQAEEIEIRRERDSPPKRVYVVKNSSYDSLMVNRTCPRCGHHEAFYRASVISGEHAGVKQERTIEHYRCAKCSHSWTLS
ncbi:hypothetical protein AC482_02520 [miscellaneous Crenarchaeota group-15 archaeon DG-45]|uniref:TFIIS-type domain-containing protein n=1 Tax=miscellaneous Crenarchaeota group-15 archaeon DG-45 TaxID=1685127 RepID=A0A0M0BR74_9ARCH|nr:MAG: hypothetical protein AC482_02520 [miscellaneous Crenarchaeota group-15 archaeon DG-45]